MRMRETRVRCRSTSVAAALGVCLLGGCDTALSERDTALALYERGLTAKQQGDWLSAMRHFRDAWATRPDWMVPLLEIQSMSGRRNVPDSIARTLDAIALASGDSLLLTCARYYYAEVLPYVAAIGPSDNPATNSCARAYRDGIITSNHLAFWSAFPESRWAAEAHLQVLTRENPERGLKLAESLDRKASHSMVRLRAMIGRGRALHELGAHERAVEWEDHVAAVARDLGPGAELELLLSLLSHAQDIASDDLPDWVATHGNRMSDSSQSALVQLASRVDRIARWQGLQAVTFLQRDTDKQAEALVSYRWLIALADSLESPKRSAISRAGAGRALVKLGRYEEAERELRLAKAIAAQDGPLETLRETAHDLLHLMEGQRRFPEAVLAGRDFAAYAEALKTPATRMMAYHDMGWVMRRAGDAEGAAVAFEEMVAAIDEMRDEHVYAGEYFEYAGFLDRAADYYEKAMVRNRIRALEGLMRISEAVGDTASAGRYARLADRDSSFWYAEYVPALPGVLARQGRLDEARIQYVNVRAGARSSGRQQTFARLTADLAELELDAGMPQRAFALADSAFVAARDAGIIETASRSLAVKALAGAAMGAPRADVEAVLAEAFRLGATMGLPQLSAWLHKVYGDIAARFGDAASALEGYSRAMTWADTVSSHLDTDPRRAGFRASHATISNRALALIAQDSALGRRIERHMDWSVRRKVAGRADRAAVRELFARSREFAVLDYAVLDTMVVALVVHDGRAELRTLPITGDTLRARVARFLAPIAPMLGTSVDVARLGFDAAAADDLYSALLDPILRDIPRATRLVIIPDGVLHRLPFDALVSARGDQLRYVVDDFTVSYAPALDAVLQHQPRRTALSVLAVQGPDAYAPAGIGDEIATIGGILGQHLTVLRGTDASASGIRGKATTASVLHFATHAEANDVNPDYARLAVNAEGEGDGWLNAAEVRSLPLSGVLVVLSACETAAGRVVAGEGTLSLSRAFRQAGAAGTVATLWPVSRESVPLMRAFYAGLVEGLPPAEALRGARLALRGSGGEQSHPFYWAAHVLMLNAH